MSAQGEDLRKIREAMSMSRADLAMELEISPDTIKAYETGKTPMKRMVLLAAMALDYGQALKKEQEAKKRMLLLNHHQA